LWATARTLVQKSHVAMTSFIGPPIKNPGYANELDHMQTICTLLQTDDNTSSLNFYRPDALPDAQQQCQSTVG